MRRLMLLGLTLVLLGAEPARGAVCAPQGVGDGVYYCCNGWGDWPTTNPIPVYINTNITDICGGSSTCGTFDDVRWQVEAALNEFYSSTGTKLRFYYAGSTTQSAGGGTSSEIDGAIHLYASETDCNGVVANAAANGAKMSGSQWVGYGKIRMCVTTDGVANAWAASHRGGSYKSFRAIFLHELGHVIGMDHTDELFEGCMTTPGAAGLMKGSDAVAPSDNISAAYIEYVKDIYAQRTNFGHSFWSTIGTSWSTSANAPSQANFASTRFAASNSRSSSNLFIGWRHHDNRIGFSKFTGGAWSYLGLLPHFGWSHIGIASITNSEFMVAFQVHWERVLGAMDIKIRQTTNGGSSWNWPVLQSSSATKTTAPGVASTYDPASQQYITVWRKQAVESQITSAEMNVIAYRASGASNSYTLAGVRAADTPSIACGPTSVVGTNNCLLAYITSEDWKGIPRYRHCRILSGQLSCGAEYTHGYISVGSPVVAYSGTSYPWSIAISQGGSAVYSWRSQSVNPAQWITQKSVSFSPKAILPALGSRSASQDRRYIYSLDD